MRRQPLKWCPITLIFVRCSGYFRSKKFWSTKDPGQQPFTFQVGMGSGELLPCCVGTCEINHDNPWHQCLILSAFYCSHQRLGWKRHWHEHWRNCKDSLFTWLCLRCRRISCLGNWSKQWACFWNRSVELCLILQLDTSTLEQRMHHVCNVLQS